MKYYEKSILLSTHYSQTIFFLKKSSTYQALHCTSAYYQIQLSFLIFLPTIIWVHFKCWESVNSTCFIRAQHEFETNQSFIDKVYLLYILSP